MGVLVELRPAWLPDWRDPSAYPKANKRTPSGIWAWEFLRRNIEYRGSFEFARKNAVYAQEAAARWRLKEMVDPAIGWASRDVNAVRFVRTVTKIVHPHPYGVTSTKGARAVVVLGASEVAVVFDLSRPIEIQTTDAKVSLIRSRDEKIRQGMLARPGKSASPVMRKMPTYLRVLDALSVLAVRDAHRELRAVLYPRSDPSAGEKVRADIERAQDYRDTGYHELLRQEPDHIAENFGPP